MRRMSFLLSVETGLSVSFIETQGLSWLSRGESELESKYESISYLMSAAAVSRGMSQ